MKEAFNVIKDTFTQWQEDKASRLAAALSLYTILSIPPLLVLTLTLVGQFADRASAREALLSQVDQFLGPQALGVLSSILESASQPQGISLASILSLGLLLFSASGVFMQLQDALNTIWDVMPAPDGGIMNTLRKRAISFLMVLAIGVMLLLLLLVNSFVTLLDQYLSQVLPFPITWGLVLNYIISFLILTGIIALLFKEIPDVKVEWRDVMVGSFVTTILLILGVLGISLYMTYSDPTSSYGAAGSLIVLLLWVYYSAQIFFLGAEFTQVYANRYGDRIRPDEHAVFEPGAAIDNKSRQAARN